MIRIRDPFVPTTVTAFRLDVSAVALARTTDQIREIVGQDRGKASSPRSEKKRIWARADVEVVDGTAFIECGSHTAYARLAIDDVEGEGAVSCELDALEGRWLRPARLSMRTEAGELRLSDDTGATSTRRLLPTHARAHRPELRHAVEIATVDAHALRVALRRIAVPPSARATVHGGELTVVAGNVTSTIRAAVRSESPWSASLRAIRHIASFGGDDPSEPVRILHSRDWLFGVSSDGAVGFWRPPGTAIASVCIDRAADLRINAAELCHLLGWALAEGTTQNCTRTLKLHGGLLHAQVNGRDISARWCAYPDVVRAERGEAAPDFATLVKLLRRCAGSLDLWFDSPFVVRDVETGDAWAIMEH